MLYSCNALLFGLVGKHLSSTCVANTVDGWHCSLPGVVSDDLAAFIHCDASVFKSESTSECVTSDANKADVDVKSALLIVLRVLYIQLNTVRLVVDAIAHLCVQHKLDALLL